MCQTKLQLVKLPYGQLVRLQICLWKRCLQQRYLQQKYLETNFVHVCVLNCSVMSDSLPPHGWTVARQAPLSMGFAWQEHQSGVLFPSPGDLPNPRIEPLAPALQVDSLPLINKISMNYSFKVVEALLGPQFMYYKIHLFKIYNSMIIKKTD